MKTKFLCVAAGLLLLSKAYALPDLLSIYAEGLEFDPVFQAAYSQRLSAEESLPEARSGTLPQIRGTAEIGRSHQETTDLFVDPGSTSTRNFNSQDYVASVSQPVFNFASWKRIGAAKSTIRQAEATFNASAQDLMFRTAESYFRVLEAQDTLRFVRALKDATRRQLEQAEERFKVGLVAVTAVYEAQAEYDAVIAQEITAENDVINRKEALRNITGRFYPEIAPLRAPVPLERPQPENVDSWVDIAVVQNYTLLAAGFGADVARENIKVEAAGNLPTVDLVGRYVDRRGVPVADQSISDKVASVNVQVNFPVYQGGLTQSRTRRAQYDYETATSQFDGQYLNTIVTTRQTYNDVLSSISRVEADKQAIVSAENQFESTDAQFRVGTRTMVDVLDAQRNLFEQQRNYAINQYNYIIANLRLKLLSGTLSGHDIEAVNALLNPDSTRSYLDDDTNLYLDSA